MSHPSLVAPTLRFPKTSVWLDKRGTFHITPSRAARPCALFVAYTGLAMSGGLIGGDVPRGWADGLGLLIGVCAMAVVLLLETHKATKERMDYLYVMDTWCALPLWVRRQCREIPEVAKRLESLRVAQVRAAKRVDRQFRRGRPVPWEWQAELNVAIRHRQAALLELRRSVDTLSDIVKKWDTAGSDRISPFFTIVGDPSSDDALRVARDARHLAAGIGEVLA